jgi:ABC-2 type transport system ATP-binding protein
VPLALEFDGVTKTYRRGVLRPQAIHALRDFSLSVERGEIFGFLGPNGAGKTTAIHIALGFMRPTSGSGSMLGHPFGHAPTRARVGFLAENVAFYSRPAEQLIAFYGALNAVSRGDLAARTREALEAVSLWTDADRNVSKFSRGMQQRVGLAQVLVNDPELLILDEPTSALDPLARVAVREMLVEARERGKTIFLSSHMLSEIELICDRVAVLHRGRLLRVARTGDLLASSGRIEILARGVSADQFSASAVADDVVRIDVPATAQRATLERVWSLGGEVVSVNPLRRGLEEVFVELTRDAGEEPRR